MAQGPPMFQTSREQRYAPDEDDDASFFASLRPDSSYQEMSDYQEKSDPTPLAEHSRYEDDVRESRHSRLSDPRMPDPVDPWTDDYDDRASDVREIPEIDDRRPPTWDSYIDDGSSAGWEPDREDPYR